MQAQQRVEGGSKGLAPVVVAVRVGETQQGKGGRGAHRREVAQIDGKRPVADVGRGRIGKKVHTLDDGVGRRDELLARRYVKHGPVVTHTERDVVAQGPAPGEIAFDQFELTGQVTVPRVPPRAAPPPPGRGWR